MEPLLWDYQIISYLAAALFGLYLVIISSKRLWPELKKKQKTQRALLGAFFIVIFVTIFYGSFIEPKIITVTNIDLDLNKTQKQENIKIVLIADVHAGDYKKGNYYTKLANKIKDLKPDIIVIAGDFVATNEKDVEAMRPLSIATKIFPSYAVTGNHEYKLGSEKDFYKDKIEDRSGPVLKVLREIEVKVIDNKSQLVNHDGNIFYLAGIKDLWTQPDDNDLILQNLGGYVSESMPKVLLAHNPDVILTKNSDLFDLILSGHTHGGQIRLPFIGPIPRIPNNLGRAFDQGLFNLESGNKLYITRGVSESGPRARLFAPPEITVISLNL